MNTTPTMCITTSVALVVCLLGGAVSPVVAVQQTDRTVTAKAPLLKKTCMKQFHHDEREKLHYRANVAWRTYEQNHTTSQVLYDSLRWSLADPNEQDAVPVIEQQAESFLAQLRPVVAKQRDNLYKDLGKFRSKYLNNGCLPSKDGKSVFKQAMRYYKKSSDDIFKADGRLFAANMHIQTAQADLAGQALRDADLEFATVEENAIHCNELLETLS